MAQLPSQEEIEKLQQEGQAEIEAKVVTQAAEGKSFNVPADGHGPGVVPEDVWRNLPGKKEEA